MYWVDCSWLLLLAGGGDTRQLYEYIVKEGPKSHRCTVCGKVGSDRGNMRKHVENIHFNGSFIYDCKYCSQTFTSRNKLNHHISGSHKSYVWNIWLMSVTIVGCRWQAVVRIHCEGWTPDAPLYCLWQGWQRQRQLEEACGKHSLSRKFQLQLQILPGDFHLENPS